jgi:putative nucleotidyltransferase with HDIG domain
MAKSQTDLRFSILTALVVAALFGSLEYAGWQAQAAGWSEIVLKNDSILILVVLIIGVLVAGYRQVAVPGAGQISVSYPIGVAAAVFFGPLWAATVAAADAVFEWFQESDGFTLKVFNTAQVCLAAVVPGVAYIALGGKPLYLIFQAHQSLGRQSVLALVAAGTLGAVVNLGLSVVGFSVYKSRPLSEVVTSLAGVALPSQLALGLVGLAVAQVLFSVNYWGFALFVAPLLVAQQTYQRSEDLRQAYADTIASLVASLEAKDVYTKGHSVRVAKYTMAIARHLGLADRRIERLEWAALLHDIGKVGIDRRVLAKPSRLSESEYAAIKEHPAIGARILAQVPYLTDLIPSIEAHHEKLDGSGYGRGVNGDQIPLEARILAVADSYDAMTSTRPYRDAMSDGEARGELERCRGTQFDGSVIDAFESALAEEPELLDDEVRR